MKRADGPFTVGRRGHKPGFGLKVGKFEIVHAEGVLVMQLFVKPMTNALVSWLKTKQGAEWMRENGVGNASR